MNARRGTVVGLITQLQSVLIIAIVEGDRADSHAAVSPLIRVIPNLIGGTDVIRVRRIVRIDDVASLSVATEHVATTRLDNIRQFLTFDTESLLDNLQSQVVVLSDPVGYKEETANALDDTEEDRIAPYFYGLIGFFLLYRLRSLLDSLGSLNLVLDAIVVERHDVVIEDHGGIGLFLLLENKILSILSEH